MLVTSVFGALLSLSSLATAAPHAQFDTGLSRRGMEWTPKSLLARDGSSNVNNNNNNNNKNNNKNNNNKNDVSVTDITIVSLTEESRNSEVQLTVLIEQKLSSENSKSKRESKDNIRKNHYANKNSNVDTVIIVITEILDVRNNKQNKRYMSHQVEAKGKNNNNNNKNNNNNNKVVIAVTEIEILTVGKPCGSGQQCAGSATVDAASASAGVAAAIQTVDPNAPFQQANMTMLLPADSAAPSFANTDADPAKILEPNQADIIVEVITVSNSNSKSDASGKSGN